ncbi:MAG: hypothetical protein VKK04_02725 [Synechococcales bacterium]|nr:hypothetical protein [Synechococcales bacterium]
MIDFIGLDEFIKQLGAIASYDFQDALTAYFDDYYKPQAIARFDQAAEQTPYAPSSIGTKKRVSGATRGGGDDPGFGIDSGRLRSDLTGENAEVTDSAIAIFSELPYAARIASLFAEKGPFPEGLPLVEEADLVALEDAIANDIERFFS